MGEVSPHLSHCVSQQPALLPGETWADFLDVQLCKSLSYMLLIYQASQVQADFLSVAVCQLPRAKKSTCKQQKHRDAFQNFNAMGVQKVILVFPMTVQYL